MSEKNPDRQDPKAVRYAPGTDPVPEDQQIPEFPSDSAAWMNHEPMPYFSGPLFPDDPELPGPVDQEATDG